MTKEQVLAALAALPPEVGPKLLQDISAIWRADQQRDPPVLLAQLQAGNYKPLLRLIAKEDPELFADLVPWAAARALM